MERTAGRRWGQRVEKCNAVGCDATKKETFKKEVLAGEKKVLLYEHHLCAKHAKIYKEDPTAIDFKEL